MNDFSKDFVAVDRNSRLRYYFEFSPFAIKLISSYLLNLHQMAFSYHSFLYIS